MKSTPPNWLSDGVVFVGNWESLAARTRFGGGPVDLRERFEEEHSETTVLRLKELGVNMILTHFFKTGLRVEERERELTRKLSDLCHRHGMRIGTYIGGTIYYETLVQDAPECVEWAAQDSAGRPIRRAFCSGLHRYQPCYNRRGYREFLKRVVTLAIEEARTDLVHFDNLGDSHEPHACRCAVCAKLFTEFLYARYPDKGLREERYGFDDLTPVVPPDFPAACSAEQFTSIDDPSYQDWLDFRCERMADFYREMADHATRLKPEVVIECNPNGILPGNVSYRAGIDHPRLVKHGGVFWTEESVLPSSAPGRVISRVRSFKAAQATDNILFAYAFGSDLAMIESIAFNGATLGCVGHIPAASAAGDGGMEALERELRRAPFVFYRQHKPYLTRTRSIADIAVLRSFSSLAFSAHATGRAVWLVEQALLHSAMPFATVYNDDLQVGPLPHAVLVLAGQTCLSDEQIERIRRHLHAGQGVVACRDTGTRDAWRRTRRQSLVDALLKSAEAAEELVDNGLRARIGKGYLAVIDPVAPSADGASALFTPPENTKALADAVLWAAGGTLSVQVKAPPVTVVEVRQQEESNRLCVNLINYDVNPPEDDVSITVRRVPFRSGGECCLLQPGRPKADLRVAVRDDGLTVTFRFTGQYALLVFTPPG